MSLFNFNMNEMLTFFAVLIRFSILFSVLPFIGEKSVPSLVKVLLALVVSIALFPALVASGNIHPRDAGIWSSSVGGIVGTIVLEIMLGFTLGYTARLAFQAITVGANLVGNFMGFGIANTYDPSQEAQTEVVAQMQTSIAMLVFLAINGHHLMLRAALNSYKIVGLGKASVTSAALSQHLIQMTGQVFAFAFQISAPVSISLFCVNIAFGVISKSMPQLNIFMLSFAVSALVGLCVLFLSMPDFQNVMGNILGRIGDWMEMTMMALAGGK